MYDQGHVAWFSSIGSHMGHETNTTRRLFSMFRHKSAPLMVNFSYYTMAEVEKSRDNPGVFRKCYSACIGMTQRETAAEDSFGGRNSITVLRPISASSGR